MNKLGCAFLFPLFLQIASVNAALATATETCPNPGSYFDSATLLLNEKTVATSLPASDLPIGDAMPAVTYKLDEGGMRYGLSEFLKETRVAAFIVLHRGKVVKEIYCDGYPSNTQFNFQSITKSIISTLIAIMLKEHPDYSVETAAGTIAPALRGSIYEEAPLSSILQMSSRAEFADVSDMNGLFTSLIAGASLAAKVKSQGQANDPGRQFRYSGIDTSALGMVLAAATKKTNAGYLEEKIWKPLGMEAPAVWRTNQTNEDMPFCCLYANLRDIARFGKLMADDGVWNGTRLLPEGWVHRATHPDSEHLMPGDNGTKGPFGYQYQWWTEPYTPDTFYGQGIYGQNLYIDPQAGIVAVVTSKWPKAQPKDRKYYAHTRKFMRAISRHYRGQ